MDQTPPTGTPQPPAEPAPASVPAGWGQAAQQPAPQPVPQPVPPAAVPPQPAPSAWAQPTPGPAQWVVPVAQSGPVTVLARIGGLFLVLIGLFWGLIGLAFVVGAGVVKNYLDVSTLPGYADFFGGALATVGIVILVAAIVEVLAGIGGMLGKGWARALGIIYAFVFGAFSLFIVTQGGRAGDGSAGGVLFFAAHLVLYAYVLIIFLVRWRGRAVA
jgi:hypothetical protein